MMVAVFTAMSLAMIAVWVGPRRVAIALFALSLLRFGLFLYEIYSPEYGFRMPWIQTGANHLTGACMSAVPSARRQRTLAMLNYIYLVLVMFVIAGILTAAMTLQYTKGEYRARFAYWSASRCWGFASAS